MDYKKAEESTVHYMEAGAAAGGNGRATRATGTDGRKRAAAPRVPGSPREKAGGARQPGNALRIKQVWLEPDGLILRKLPR